MTLIERIIAALDSIGLDIKSNKTSIGNVALLETTDKTSLVAAVNEVVAAAPGGVASRVTVGTIAPTAPGEYMWVQTDGNGNLVDILVGNNL